MTATDETGKAVKRLVPRNKFSHPDRQRVDTSEEVPVTMASISKKLAMQLDTCLSYPERTLFLDIETTGLSHYYDDITLIGWAMDGVANTIIGGSDVAGFRNTVTEAKALVTFNGIRFDTKFIVRDYPDIVLPDLHIDLMYLCRRVGLTGGQKAIEQLLDINMRDGLEDVGGAEAVVLWHRYIRGDNDALRKLILYNRSDIAAMGAILDEAIDRLPLQKTLFAKNVKFIEWSAPTNWKSVSEVSSYDKMKEEVNLTYGRAFGDNPYNHHIKCVGIDLTGSEGKPSGWCVLVGSESSEAMLASDRDIVARTLSEEPDIISIDSPLCLPSGRVRVSDDDPGREQYGIMRECERELKRRGINVYPCLIKSMQKLTERGIRLAGEFRAKGIPVIESYPGAAQDIMRIPRKGAGVNWLRLGLQEFGITSQEELENASHDELDAITAALVGVFHWFGMSEELGTADEDPLIIPCRNMRDIPRVVGVSGPIAAGKTTFSRSLEKRGFSYTRFSLVIDNILQKRKVMPSRVERQSLGDELNREGLQRWLCRQTVKRAKDAKLVVVDGLRFPEDGACLGEMFGANFHHVHVDAFRSTRRSRYKDAGGGVGFDQAEAAGVEQCVNELGTLATEVFVNEQGLVELTAYAEDVAKKCKGDL